MHLGEPTKKSGDWCPTLIQNSMKYVTEQGKKRDSGDMDNIITKTLLAGGNSDSIRTDDWMSFYADIPSGAVQYGGRSDLCNYVNGLKW